MFWIIQYSGVQLLIALWLLQLLYAAYATVKGRFDDRFKPFIIILLFVSMYCTIDISQFWLGTPSFTNDEVVGILDGYDKITVEGKPMMSVMVTTKTGPFMFVVPYNSKTDDDLRSSMAKKADSGIQTMIRKRSSKQLDLLKSGNTGKEGNKGTSNGGAASSIGDGQMEFYDFTDQLLQPKHDDNK
jgi:hypothetical protein